VRPCGTSLTPGGAFVLPEPQGLSRVEVEHLRFHQLAHIVLGHARQGKVSYSTKEERYAEAFDDAMWAAAPSREPAPSAFLSKQNAANYAGQPFPSRPPCSTLRSA